MATTSDIKNGLCIELNNDILRVIDFQRFQVGRGSGKVWTKLKSSVRFWNILSKAATTSRKYGWNAGNFNISIRKTVVTP